MNAQERNMRAYFGVPHARGSWPKARLQWRAEAMDEMRRLAADAKKDGRDFTWPYWWPGDACKDIT